MHFFTGSTARTFRPAMLALAIGVLASSLLIAACGADDDASEPTPAATGPATEPATPSVTPTATEPPAATETATSSPPASALAAPTDVVLTGPLPDTSATVTPGQGETGRVAIEWAYSGEADGFRVYQRDCDGEPRGEPIEVGAEERMYGPLQPCRPGGEIGVAAFDESGESEIVWAVPGEAT